MNTRILCFAISGVMLLLGSAQMHAQAIAQGRLLASDAAPQNNFSQSMDIDGDVAVVSNSTATNPYVFERVNGVWTEVARLAPGESTLGYNYGIDVAVSGNTIAVGALKSSGALPHFGLVYLFEKINGSWTKVARLTAANANTPQDGIGGSIDLSGNRLVVGDPGFNGPNNSAPGQGAAYVYVKTAAGWQFESLLIASDRASYDGCGDKVAIEGDRILVGCVGSDNGNVNIHFNAGAGFVYQRNGSVWQQAAKLIAAVPSGGEFLSKSIALSGNQIALGAPYANSGNLPNSGGVDTFEFDGTSWIRKPRIISPNLRAEQNFGAWGLAFSGASLLVGVPQHVVNAQAYGSMFHFKPAGPANTWTHFQRSEAYDNVAGQYFGESIEVSGETIMVSARAHNSNRGAAYLLFDGIFLKDGFESL